MPNNQNKFLPNLTNWCKVPVRSRNNISSIHRFSIGHPKLNSTRHDVILLEYILLPSAVVSLNCLKLIIEAHTTNKLARIY